MVIAIKVVLLILGFLLSLFFYTIVFALVWMTITGTRAIGLPALLYNLPYWALMILLLSAEVWIAIHKVRW